MKPINKRSIVIVTTGLSFGGAETQLLQLAIRLKVRGWAVIIVSMLNPLAFVEELNSHGIAVYSLKMMRGKPDPRAIYRLARILRAIKPAIVHSHMVHANILARLARLMYWEPVLVCTAHNVDEGGRLREIAYRLTDFLCDLTTNVSQAAVNRYIQVGAVPQKKIQFVPNGIDLDKFGLDYTSRCRLRNELNVDSRFVWLAVGRFELAKDYPNMIKAFSRTTVEYPQAVLLIAGEGTLEDEVRELTARLGLIEKVRFLGVRRDVPELMNAADAYVMSSAWEGLPMVLLEAAASSLAIVATDVGGNREIVISGQNGFLVPCRNHESLALAMSNTMALGDKERYVMGVKGREIVAATYDFEHVLSVWEDIYRKLLDRRRML